MDGKGRALDNIFTERLWRTVKYEEVYLHGYAAPARHGRGWPSSCSTIGAPAPSPRLPPARRGLLRHDGDTPTHSALCKRCARDEVDYEPPLIAERPPFALVGRDRELGV